jgi:hypothetical protein
VWGMQSRRVARVRERTLQALAWLGTRRPPGWVLRAAGRAWPARTSALGRLASLQLTAADRERERVRERERKPEREAEPGPALGAVALASAAQSAVLRG